MRLNDIPMKLSALALAGLLPLSMTACGDDVTGVTESGDDTTGGSTTDDTNPTNPATSITTTTDPGTTTTDPTVADSSGTTDDPTTETDTSVDTEGDTEADTETTDPGTSSGGAESSSSGGGEAVCGDGVAEGKEACDGDDLAGAACPVLGDVACADDCTLDLSACVDTLTVCNTPAAAIDGTTTQDMPLTDVSDVTTLAVSPDVNAGSVLTNALCGQDDDIDARFDDDGAELVCNSDMPPAISGDVLPLTELRDLIGISSMGDWTFVAWDTAPDFDDGALNEWCLEFTLSADDPVTCGDDTAHYGEVCDGADTNAATCESLEMGFIGGTLGCMADCSDFDTSACAAPGCNGGVIDGDEVCDGDDLGGMTCDDFDGFTGDGLACNADCGGFDTSGCTPVVCGDDMANGDEECDGADLGGIMGCGDLPGFTGDGGVTCSAECTYDTSACESTVIEVCSTPAADIINTEPPTVDTVNFADPGNVADVDVFVDITHTWLGDLAIELNSPADTTALIFDACGNVDNMNAIFDDDAGVAPACAGDPGVSGNTLPNEALSVFDGEAIAGDWTLTVTDSVNGDNGVLNEWCVRITPEE
jgi:subtilisin-like proprotein convertase family protein